MGVFAAPIGPDGEDERRLAAAFSSVGGSPASRTWRLALASCHASRLTRENGFIRYAAQDALRPWRADELLGPHGPRRAEAQEAETGIDQSGLVGDNLRLSGRGRVSGIGAA